MAPDSDLTQILAERDEARAQLVELRRRFADIQAEHTKQCTTHARVIQRLWATADRLTHADDEQPTGAPGASRSSYSRGLAEGKAMAAARFVIALGHRPEPLTPPINQPEETPA